MSGYLDFTCSTARKAGKIAVKLFREGFTTSYKSDEPGHLSPVTEADRKSEESIISSIKRKYPSHGIISEEAGKFMEKEEYVWLVDPIDGTRNFSRKIPRFSVSIALLYKGVPICGAVYDPNMDEMFYAEKGKGAFINGNRISVSSTSDIKKAAISIDGAMTPDARKVFPLTISKIIFHVETIWMPGGAALDLCYTACGRFDGTVNLKCHPWDAAAAGLILREAGGIIEDAKGIEVFPFMTRYVAGNRFVEKHLMNLLAA